MARKAMIEKANKTPKFAVRQRNRCKLCGRPRGYIRFFMMCRLCFRKLALTGVLPGVKKTSW
jgi:small subunit ribosomal protein S14